MWGGGFEPPKALSHSRSQVPYFLRAAHLTTLEPPHYKPAFKQPLNFMIINELIKIIISVLSTFHIMKIFSIMKWFF